MKGPKMPEKNYPLLWKVYEHIEAHPEEWMQAAWAIKSACGTAYCFAGHAVLIAEPTARFIFSSQGESDRVHVLGHGMRWIDEVAMDALGLRAEEASVLFNGSNGLGDLRYCIRRWEQEDA
jgi:hypothetical protein